MSPSVPEVVNHIFAGKLDHHHTRTFINSLDQHGRIMAEYVWVGGNGPLDLRSKTRVLDRLPSSPEDLPHWNYDGSSTGQAPGHNSDVILVPRAVFRDPFRLGDNIIVICDCHKWVKEDSGRTSGDCGSDDGINGSRLEPIESNTREPARLIFEKFAHERPLFGMEQEYCIMDQRSGRPLCWPASDEETRQSMPQGPFYCGNGFNRAFGRDVVESHARCCLHAGVKLSGINAEVMPSQWEFQVGPCEGIDMGDHLTCARYLLLRVAEIFGVTISFDPKPMQGFNGSGCHCNYSTEKMRQEGGLKHILAAIDRLAGKHKKHLAKYGEGNERRLLGMYETASMDKFTWGYGDRSASVRVGRDTKADGKGYLEDRRPASNCDPYVVSSLLVETTCVEEK